VTVLWKMSALENRMVDAQNWLRIARFMGFAHLIFRTEHKVSETLFPLSGWRNALSYSQREDTVVRCRLLEWRWWTCFFRQTLWWNRRWKLEWI